MRKAVTLAWVSALRGRGAAESDHTRQVCILDAKTSPIYRLFMSPLTPTETARDYINSFTRQHHHTADTQLCRAYETICEAYESTPDTLNDHDPLIRRVKTFLEAQPGKFPKTEAAFAERAAADEALTPAANPVTGAGEALTPAANPAVGAGTAHPSPPQALPGSGFVTAGILVCIASILIGAIFASKVYPASVRSEGSIADMTIQALGDRYITHFNWLMFILFSGIGSTIGTILFVGGSIQKAIFSSANLARRQP